MARKVGRPTAYKEEYAEQAEKFCMLGATTEELARLFGVATSTVSKWLVEIPEFSESVKKGRDIADANVGHRLYQRATGYSHPEEKIFCQDGEVIRAQTVKHYPPETTAAIFWLKNRRPDLWRDVQKREVEINDKRKSLTETEELLRQCVEQHQEQPSKPH